MDEWSHWLTVLVSIIGTSIVTIGGAVFWIGRKNLEYRVRLNEVRSKEAMSDQSERSTAFSELEKLSTWQSEQFRKRSEEVDKRLSDMQAAMTLLYRDNKKLQEDHSKCEAERIIQAAQMTALRIEMDAMKSLYASQNSNMEMLASLVAHKLKGVAEDEAVKVVTTAAAVAAELGKAKEKQAEEY